MLGMEIEGDVLAILEKFGLDAVPVQLRKSRWYDYLIMQFTFSFNIGNFLLPSLAVIEGHLSFFMAIFSIALGNLIAYIIVSIYSIPGVDYGIPGQYAMRATLGVGGARFFSSPLRVLISIYWFTVQALGAAVVIKFLLDEVGISASNFILIAIILSVVITFIAIIGFRAVTRSIKAMIPVMLMAIILLWVLFLSSDSPNFQWSYVSHFAGENNLTTFFIYCSLAFAQYIGSLSGSADICRYAKTRKDAFFGLLAGNFFGIIVTSSLAIYSAIAIGEWNPYIAAASLTDSKFAQLLILLGVMISLLSINLNNAYTGGFSLINTFPKLSRIVATVLIGLAAAGLCLFPSIIENAAGFISFLGSLAAPLAGVIIVDYLIIKRMKIEVEALDLKHGIYYYFHGYNRAALIAILIGFVFFHTVPNDVYPVSLTSFLLSGAMYLSFKYIPMAKLNALIESIRRRQR